MILSIKNLLLHRNFYLLLYTVIYLILLLPHNFSQTVSSYTNSNQITEFQSCEKLLNIVTVQSNLTGNIFLFNNASLDSIIAYTVRGNKYKRQFIYDTSGNLMEMIVSYTNQKSCELDRKVTNQYNEDGNMIYSYTGWWNGAVWEVKRRVTYKYNVQRNLINSLEEMKAENSWEAITRSFFEYDQNGNQILLQSERKGEAGWMITDRLTMDYNSNGFVETALYEVFQDGKDYYFFSEFEYDYNWRLASITHTQLVNHQWENYARMIYNYDTDNSVIRFFEIWNDELSKWESLERFTQNYMDELLVSTFNESFNGTQWEPQDGVTVVEYPGGYKEGIPAYEVRFFYDNTTTVKEIGEKLLNNYELFQNYPNPFNPSTRISYTIPEATEVQLKIFNSLGQLVETLVDNYQAKGSYKIEFNAEGLSSGIYVAQLTAGKFSRNIKMLLIK